MMNILTFGELFISHSREQDLPFEILPEFINISLIWFYLHLYNMWCEPRLPWHYFMSTVSFGPGPISFLQSDLTWEVQLDISFDWYL